MAEMPESTTSEALTTASAGQRISWYRDWVLMLAISTVIAVDQLSKFLIRQNLAVGESWPATGVLRLTHGTNTGSAFGLFPNQTLFLIVASVFAIGFIYYFYKTHAMPRRVVALAIGMQLGGAVGNLIDRLRVGAVVDFLDVGRWPIFNLADSSIVVGMVILFSVLLFSGKESQPGSTLEPDSWANGSVSHQ